MKKVVITIGAIIGILVIIGIIYFIIWNIFIKNDVVNSNASNNKSELTLINIDDLNYEPQSTYLTTFVLKNGDNYYQVKGHINFSKNDCYYYSEWVDEFGSYNFESMTCTYKFSGEYININLDGILTFKDTMMVESQEEIMDYQLNGTFKYDNKSHIILNDITYVNEKYQKYLDYNTHEILVDSENNDYKEDGTRPWADGDSIDISSYEIIDKRKNDNNTSDYSNILDITNIVTSNIINKTDYSEVRDVNASELLKLFDTNGLYFIILGSKTCMPCQNLLNDLKSIQVEYSFQSIYINIISQNNDDKELIKNKLISSYGSEEIANNFLATPRLIVLENGKIQDYTLGYGSKDNLLNFLNENGIIY